MGRSPGLSWYPAVLTEGAVTYLYTGFSGRWDKDRSGSMAVVLDADMLTVLEAPVCVGTGGTRYGPDTLPFPQGARRSSRRM